MVVPRDPELGYDSADESALGDVKGVADAAGKTVVAAALAGAVATGAAAVTPDQINLPEPVPIVQTVDQGADLPDQTVDDHADKKASAWKNIFKVLKYAILALFFAAAFFFGVLQGCAGCAGQAAAPIMQDTSSSEVEASASTETEASEDAAASSAA